MFQFDFSETKRQWNLLKTAVKRNKSDEVKQTAGGRALLAPLVTKLDVKETAFWIIFAVAGVFAMIMILTFIDSFIIEQDKYQTALTSIGRHSAEYGALASETGTTTGEVNR